MSRYPRSEPGVWYPLVAGGLFFLSGASGLMYQTAWSRLFQDLFGHGVHTNAAVLAAFMAGLGLGAAVGGRAADRLSRPLLVYGVLEAVIVVLVVTSPAQVGLADRMFPTVARAHALAPAVGGVVRWAVAFSLVVLPTALMGATLPILSRALARTSGQLGRAFGSLYGVNTLGAVSGVVAAGFWLIRDLGVTATLYAGCVLGLTAAVGGVALHLIWAAPPPGRPARDAVAEGRHAPLPWALLMVVFGSGFTVLACEIAWIRALVFVLDSNVLSFATVLGALLLAMGLGSVAMPWVVRRRGLHLAALGWSQVVLGGLSGLTVLALAHLDVVETAVAATTGIDEPLATLAGRAVVTVAVLFGPGVLMGAALPAATGAIRDLDGAGRQIGLLYLATTAGNIAGSLAAGYLLVPLLGAGRTVLAMALLNLGLGLAVLLWTRSAPRIVVGAIAVGGVLALGVVSGPASTASPAEMAAYRTPHASLTALREGLWGTVTVSDVPPMPILADNGERPALAPVAFGYRMIAVDGVDVAGTAPDLRTTQRLQAHIPLLLHGQAERVLQVGFGSGETTFEGLLHEPDVYDVAEINPDVIAMSSRFFPQFTSTGYRAVFTDARNYVRTTDRVYDVILNDSTYPGISGSSLLYSVNHFEACRRRLARGGMISTWLPVDLPAESLRVILASFTEVFPEASLWLPTNCWNKHAVLVGSITAVPDPVARLGRREWPEGVRASLAELGYDTPELMASMVVLDAADIRTLVSGAMVNSDDHPVLEYPARGVAVAGEAYWSETLRMILERMGPPRPGPSGGLRSAVKRILTGQMALLDGDPDLAMSLYRRAARDAPQHPGPAWLIRDIRTFRAQAALEDGLRARSGGEDPLPLLQLAVEGCPVSAAARRELGRELLAGGRPAAAVPHLQEAVRFSKHPTHGLRLMLGDALRLSGGLAEAESIYRRCLRDSPGSAEVLAALAEAVAGQGRVEEAVTLLGEALEIRPDHAAARALRDRLTGG